MSKISQSLKKSLSIFRTICDISIESLQYGRVEFLFAIDFIKQSIWELIENIQSQNHVNVSNLKRGHWLGILFNFVSNNGHILNATIAQFSHLPQNIILNIVISHRPPILCTLFWYLCDFCRKVKCRHTLKVQDFEFRELELFLAQIRNFW